MQLRSFIAVVSVLLCVTDVINACSEYDVSRCTQPMLQYGLANNTSILPTFNEDTMRAICDTYEEGVRECLISIQSSCTPELQALFLGIDEFYYYICDEMFDEYALHRECLSTPMLQADVDQCYLTFMSNLSSISELTAPITPASPLCRYATSYISCVRDAVDQYCGPEAAAWYEELDIRTVGPTLDYIDCPLSDGHLFQWHGPVDSSGDQTLGSSTPRTATSDPAGWTSTLGRTGNSTGLIAVCRSGPIWSLVGLSVIIIIILIGAVVVKISRKRAANKERRMRSVTSSEPPTTVSAPPPYKEKDAMYGNTRNLDDGASSDYSEPPPYEAVGHPVGGLQADYDDMKNPKFLFNNLAYQG